MGWESLETPSKGGLLFFLLLSESSALRPHSLRWMFSLLLQEPRQPHPPVPVRPHRRQATAGLLRGLFRDTEAVLRAVFTKSSNRGCFWQHSPLHQPQSTAGSPGSPCHGWVMLDPCVDANTALDVAVPCAGQTGDGGSDFCKLP